MIKAAYVHIPLPVWRFLFIYAFIYLFIHPEQD